MTGLSRLPSTNGLATRAVDAQYASSGPVWASLLERLPSLPVAIRAGRRSSCKAIARRCPLQTGGERNASECWSANANPHAKGPADRPFIPEFFVVGSTRSYIILYNRISRLPERDAGSVGEHPRCNVHGCEFLEQQLGGVRDVDLRNLGLVLARTTLERLLGEIPANREFLNGLVSGGGALTQSAS